MCKKTSCTCKRVHAHGHKAAMPGTKFCAHEENHAQDFTYFTYMNTNISTRIIHNNNQCDTKRQMEALPPKCFFILRTTILESDISVLIAVLSRHVEW